MSWQQLWNEYGIAIFALTFCAVFAGLSWWHEAHWCPKCEKAHLYTTWLAPVWTASANNGWAALVTDVRVTRCSTPLCTFKPVERVGKPRRPTHEELASER